MQPLTIEGVSTNEMYLTCVAYVSGSSKIQILMIFIDSRANKVGVANTL